MIPARVRSGVCVLVDCGERVFNTNLALDEEARPAPLICGYGLSGIGTEGTDADRRAHSVASEERLLNLIGLCLELLRFPFAA